MKLKYLKRIEEIETEENNLKGLVIRADYNTPNSYVCLNVFDNLEVLNYQDKKFEDTWETKPQKLGTALTYMCSNFSNIETIVNKYIQLCNKINSKNLETTIKIKIIVPMLDELAENNYYFKLLKNYEYASYQKELENFKEVKEKILKFITDDFANIPNNNTDTIVKEMTKTVITSWRKFEDYIKTEDIKTFTLDYLHTYISEIRDIKTLIDSYFLSPPKSIYNDYKEIKKFFLFNVIENPANEFIFSTLKVEPKIKIKGKYINVWNFKEKYLPENEEKDIDINREKLLNYISKNQVKLFTTYRISTINELLSISFIEILKNNLTIRKCENCGLYFMPESRSDEKYCDNPSPQNPKKTCKEYGAKKTYREAVKSRPVIHEHTKTSQYFRMKIKRCSNTKEQQKLMNRFNKYKTDYEEKKKKYNKNEISENVFVEWIKDQKDIKK